MKEKCKPGVMLDCSRGAVYTVPAIQKFIDLIAQMGYGSLQLYTEDVYTLEGEPYFGYMRGRYSEDELRSLDAYAAEQGIELIPCIQTLAHLGGITRWGYPYGAVTDNADILLAGEERTYELIDKMFAACARCFKSRRINIGMDEAHTVGLGKYLDKHGYQNRFDILAKHLGRVSEIAKKYGFRPMMWSDMFFRLATHGIYTAEAIDDEVFRSVSALIPENVDLVYWDYYSKDEANYDMMLRAHKKLKERIVFAGGAWSWSGFAPCNGFSVAASRAAVSACEKNGVQDIFFTVWKDDGSESSLFSILPSLFCAAEYCAGNFDEKKIYARFEKLIGIAWDDYMALDLPNLRDERNEIENACKYMLYSDPFLGIFDRTVDPTKKILFTEAKQAIEKSASDSRFGYLFRTLADLCAVLEIKYDLGVRTRELYRNHNMDGLCQLLSDYTECECRVETFYESFRDQWDREAKGFGFERIDVRLGGLMQRLRHCRKVLEKYLSGELMSIEELEQDVLPFGETPDGQSISHNHWLSTATILCS